MSTIHTRLPAARERRNEHRLLVEGRETGHAVFQDESGLWRPVRCHRCHPVKGEGYDTKDAAVFAAWPRHSCRGQTPANDASVSGV